MRTAKARQISSWVGVAALLVTVAVIASFRRRRGREQSRPAAPVLAADVHQQLSGYTFTRSEGGREVFTVRAVRTVSFKSGNRTELQGVTVEVFGRTGARRDLLRTDDCDYDSSTGGFRCGGKVEVELNAQMTPSAASPPGSDTPASPGAPQPVFLETSNVTFSQQGNTLQSDALARFRYGSLSGQATGLEYATGDGWLGLRKNVVVDLPAAGGDPRLHLTAGGLRYTKRTGKIELRGPVEVSDGTGKASAASGVVLLDARNRVAQAVLQGNVHATETVSGQALDVHAGEVQAGLDTADESLQTLVATDGVVVEAGNGGAAGQRRLVAGRVQLNFAGKKPVPQDGAATGNVALGFESARTGAAAAPAVTAERRSGTLTTAELEFQFAGLAPVLHEAHTTGGGKLVLSAADPRAGERIVTAGQFLMGFSGDGRLTTVRGLKPTRIVFQPGQGSSRGPAESSADQLLATLDAASEAVQTLDQSGSVHFDGPDRHATAAHSQYSERTQSLVLTGDPAVWDPETSVRADRVVVKLDDRTAESLGNVRSTHFGALGQSDVAAAESGATAGDAIHVLADRMTADQTSEIARYEGHVRAWRGDDVLEAPWLAIDGRSRTARSGGGVVTSDLQPGLASAGFADPAGGRKRQTRSHEAQSVTRPVTVRADNLEYSDLERRATYTGHVTIQSGDATLSAERVDAFFAPASASAAGIERAVATGHVVVVEPQRRATANRAEYFAADDKFVLTGGPPTIEDSRQGFATGQRLTFYSRDGTFLLDGGAQSPALSKHRLSR